MAAKALPKATPKTAPKAIPRPPKATMALWDQVCTTDPDTTKHVEQRGGFTAIDAQSQIKRATELWGPYGKLWGLKDPEYRYVTTKSKDGSESPAEVLYEATFYCPVAEFRAGTDKAWRAGDDNRKKVETDLLTKSLSRLGFNSDVFEGKFDDNKYVEQLRREGNSPQSPPPPAAAAPPAGQSTQPRRSDPADTRPISDKQLRFLNVRMGERVIDVNKFLVYIKKTGLAKGPGYASIYRGKFDEVLRLVGTRELKAAQQEMNQDPGDFPPDDVPAPGGAPAASVANLTATQAGNLQKALEHNGLELDAFFGWMRGQTGLDVQKFGDIPADRLPAVMQTIRERPGDIAAFGAPGDGEQQGMDF